MPIEFTPVTDNSLLPFATEGGAMVPIGDENWGTWFELTGIFENGLKLGNDTYTGLRVNTNGNIQFGNGQGYQNTQIAAYNRDLDSRAAPAGVENAGIWIDENAARDSVTITWNAVGRYFRNSDLASTFQVEILDRGGSDAEVIFRYDDIQTYSYDTYTFFASFFRFQGENSQPPLAYLNVPLNDWESVEGNTGVDGVWQFRLEDGSFAEGDRAVSFRREIGTEDADALAGWLGNDIIRGLGGDDTLEGSFGADSMTGDAGDDTILGGGGNDVINGGDGADSILGGSGDDLIGAGTDGSADTVVGGAGNDTIVAADGDNRILGEDGQDDISVGDGADAVDGGEGQDTINGGGGNDTLQGGGWDDTVHGGDGADLILGGFGWDYLTGGLGDDTILGGAQNDTILGAEGNDSINVGDGRDIAWGGDGDDIITAEPPENTAASHNSFFRNANEMNGGAGNDTITGGRAADTIGGQDGNDVIDGNGGGGQLGGGLGDDTIRGGDWDQGGNDFIFGGEGADSLMGGGGNDTLFGSEGNDTILGSFGRDVILGGDGDDFIFGGEGYDLATGGAGADQFFASTEANDVTVITDYNPDEGDVLILDGELFSADNLRLRGDRLTDLSGNPAEFRSLELVYLGEDRSLEQTVFAFSNATELDRVVIRLPLPGEAGQIIDLPLF